MSTGAPLLLGGQPLTLNGDPVTLGTQTDKSDSLGAVVTLGGVTVFLNGDPLTLGAALGLVNNAWIQDTTGLAPTWVLDLS